MGLFDSLKEGVALAKEAKSIQAAQIHLAYVQEKLADAEKKVADLETENADLLRENRELRKLLESSKKEAEFLDLGMCLLKTNPAGGYFDTPLCPSCKRPLSKGMLGNYFCGPCDYHVEIGKVNAALQSLTQS